MTINEYALSILRKYDCTDDCYRGVDVSKIVDDLNAEYPDGMDFPIVEVAKEVRRIGDSAPVPVKESHRYTLVLDTDCCDCELDEFDDMDELRNLVENALCEMQVHMFNDIKNIDIRFEDGHTTVDASRCSWDDIDRYDYEIMNTCLYVVDNSIEDEDYRIDYDAVTQEMYDAVYFNEWNDLVKRYREQGINVIEPEGPRHN